LPAIALAGFLAADSQQPEPISIMLKLGKMEVKLPRQTSVRSVAAITE
jgi:hypothetical protein